MRCDLRKRGSKLDPFADRLEQWLGKEYLKIDDVLKRLLALDCQCSASGVSRWWRRRCEALYEDLALQVTGGSRMTEALKKRFEKHGVPELDIMIKLHKVLIQDLQAKGRADPQMLKQADSMMRTVMEFEAARLRGELERQKLALRERSVVVQEKKCAAYDRAREIIETNEGVITVETIRKIERELRLL